MVLHDTNFPSELADRCKRLTGCACATRAVRSALEILFDLKDEHGRLNSEHVELQEKYLLLLNTVQAKEKADQDLCAAVKRVTAPDFFALESEKVPVFKRKKR